MPPFLGRARPAAPLRRLLLASAVALGTGAASLGPAVPAAATNVRLNNGVLVVGGDAGRNDLVVGRTTAGAITLNGTEVLNGAATVADVRVVVVDGGAADDTLRIDERGGPMPPAHLLGDAGNDQLSGGSADDELFGGDGVDAILGGRGDDTILGGSGNDKVVGGSGSDVALLGGDSDQFTWNPGDDSDVVDGEGGKDTLLFNGSAANEVVDLSADSGQLRIARNVGSVALRVAAFELVKVNVSAGQDLIQVGDLTGTGTTQLQLAHAPSGGADPGFDTTVLTGTSGADRIRLFGPSAAGTVTVAGVPVPTLVVGTEALSVRGLGGDDVIDAARLTSGAVSLSESGDAGNDVLVGTPGDDTLLGGIGDDRLEGRGGRDVLDGGGGDDVIVP